MMVAGLVNPAVEMLCLAFDFVRTALTLSESIDVDTVLRSSGGS